jgi:hypothetical protein
MAPDDSARIGLDPQSINEVRAWRWFTAVALAVRLRPE